MASLDGSAMRAGFVLLSILLSQVVPLHGQDTVWAKSMGGTDFEQGTGVAVDAAGTVYTTGHFRGTVDFNPGPGVFNLTSAGSEDIFFTRTDSAGNFAGALRIGGVGADYAHGLTTDAIGNIYITGIFEGTVDFDLGASIAPRTSAGGSDVFVAKYESIGRLIWARRFGGPGSDAGRDLLIDDDGNVYITGSFEGLVDFDPGSGTSVRLSNGSADIFVSKLDSAGNFIQARTFGTEGFDIAYGIAVDSDANEYTTGFISGVSGNQLFVQKFGSTGLLGYVRIPVRTGSVIGRDVAVDESGNAYVTGSFDGLVEFDAFSFLSTSGSQNMFVAKFNANGLTEWAHPMGSTGSDSGYGVAVDAGGNVFTTGYFSGTV
ncbi:MAG: SBBP repeat-containing protein [Acidobacteria bacterium]|nr:SBBP repeat-containing protein [Acidobacteriota bacterium]MDA1234056.1 SBBP repeat-containing protein [Acidobacteriota bacterium]